MDNPLFAVVVNSFPSVDSFFLIGATLLAYATMKELDKKNGGDFKFWFLFYFHRFVRLTGVYAIVLGFHATLLKNFTDGAASHHVQQNVDTYQEMWWKNLLYINNLMVSALCRVESHCRIAVQWDDVSNCMSHSWYLAIDMQFFIISPCIIWVMWKFPRIGNYLAGLLTLAGKI